MPSPDADPGPVRRPPRRSLRGARPAPPGRWQRHGVRLRPRRHGGAGGRRRARLAAGAAACRRPVRGRGAGAGALPVARALAGRRRVADRGPLPLRRRCSAKSTSGCSAKARTCGPTRSWGRTPREMDGVAGTGFAVWAPNASRVSVVGDFNSWDGRRHPMRLRRECGVWELFLPGGCMPARATSSSCSTATASCCRRRPTPTRARPNCARPRPASWRRCRRRFRPRRHARRRMRWTRRSASTRSIWRAGAASPKRATAG